jgi:RNA polymerase sigma-70 factor (ECF subfamily)
MNEKPTKQPISDAQWAHWMRAAQGGDRAAYEQLLRELLPLLRAYVRRRVGDASAAEDLVQDVLLSIHGARHTYRPERAFGPWWRTVTRNATIDYYRRRGRRVGRELPLDGVDVAAEDSGLDDDRELSPELRTALASLPDNQRQAVELIHLQGLSVLDAAARAGVTPGALKVRAHRGYRALRRRLQEAGW